MPSNVDQFNASVRRWSRQTVPELAEQRVRAVGLEAARSVIMMTPVDTGRARGNWQTTLEAPAEGDLEVTDKSGNATLAAAASVISRAKAFGMIWLHNGLPYIEALENGWSQQAPRGMVKVTVLRLKAWLNS